jgi:Photosynthesis system II assembly factor YCF48
VALSLQGSGAQCLAVDPRDSDVVYAGLREGGLRRTSDGGGTWADCDLPAQAVFSVAVSGVDGAVYVGTEPSALFHSDDGGETWRELSALLELPSQPTWSFPPRPWLGEPDPFRLPQELLPRHAPDQSARGQGLGDGQLSLAGRGSAAPAKARLSAPQCANANWCVCVYSSTSRPRVSAWTSAFRK